MGLGVSYPLTVTLRGGLATTPDNLFTLIALSHLPGPSDNPYARRDGTESEDLTWESDNDDARAALLGISERRFRQLERVRRARLNQASVRSKAGSGEMEIAVNWTNLETGESDETVLPTRVG